MINSFAIYNILIIASVYTLIFALMYIFAFHNHNKNLPSVAITRYLFNYRTVITYIIGLVIIALGMLEFLPFPSQRLKGLALLLTLTSLYYVFHTIFYRIDRSNDAMNIFSDRLELLLEQLDKQLDKESFAKVIYNFLAENFGVNSFAMLEITEDIIPFKIIHKINLSDDFDKDLRLNSKQFYDAITRNLHFSSNLIPNLSEELKNTMNNENIQFCLPIIYHESPIGVVMFGSDRQPVLTNLTSRNWQNIVQQFPPRFALMKHIETEMEIQKMAELGKMSSQLAHDFKSFLTMINLYMDNNEMVLKHVKYMDKLVKDLSAYARSTISEKIKLNINEIIQMSIESIVIPDNINIVLQLDKELPRSLVDPHQMQRIFTNLIENSIRAMPDGGNIKITSRTLRATTYNKKPWVYIEFQDDGPGIAEDMLQKIFEPFFTTYKKQGGTGMGLAISRQIIKHHEGFIDVTSKQGKGTIFNIRLPGITGEKDA